MLRSNLLICVQTILIIISSVYCEYEIKVLTNSPVIAGGTVTFEAVLYKDGNIADLAGKFSWIDNTRPQHTRVTDYQGATDQWNVTYMNVKPGDYSMEVTVSKNVYIFDYPVATEIVNFKLTNNLNGEFKIIQNSTAVATFVSNAQPVSHEVVLNRADLNYINSQSMMVLTYWMIDCEYHGVSGDFKYETTYKIAEQNHFVEALIVGGYEPKTTTSTTTTSTTTTPATTTTTKATPSTTSNAIIKQKRSVNKKEIFVYKNSMLVPLNRSVEEVSLFCNGSMPPIPAGSVYGYFYSNFTVKAPISNFTLTGNTWVPQGDILQLQVKCDGSKNFKYCMRYYPHTYNVTGNETCINPITMEECKFGIQRYYGSPGPYTILIIISNDVGKLISPITITVYEVKKHAQLFVIVVPVTFSIVTIVLIIFGVSYYIQNRRRFTVEVANFNFGPQYADYMTFKERLRESIVNAFTRTSVNTEENEAGPIWPPNQKYGSMPRF